MVVNDFRSGAFRMIWEHLGCFRFSDVPVLFPNFMTIVLRGGRKRPVEAVLT